jgi:Flp pilus assembly protein TadD
MAPGITHEEIVRRCAETLRREPCNAKALLAMGVALHALGRAADAKSAFARAIELEPRSLVGWSNLAATLSDLGENDAALAAAERAIALDRSVAASQLILGDALRLKQRLNEATTAYREAVRLQPDSPVALNKLGCALQVAGDLGAADELLSSAVSMAPTFWIPRLNLVVVKLSRGARRDARALLAEAQSLPGLSAEARAEAEVGSWVLDEQERLEPAICAALDRGAPALIEAALESAPPRLLVPDEEFLTFADALVRNATAEAPEWERLFPVADSPSAFTPLIEAHFSSGRCDSVDALGESWRLFAAAPEAISSLSPDDQDLLRYERAIDEARRLGRPRGGGLAWEARCRFWHARLSTHRAALAPGQFKPLPNQVVTNPHVRRLPPQHVAGTLRRYFEDIHPKAPPGPVRAALVYFVIVQAHAFNDGNGRLARFLAGRELEEAGFCSAVLADSLRDSIAEALRRLRGATSLYPLIDLFARGTRVALGMARQLDAAASLRSMTTTARRTPKASGDAKT